MSDDEDISGLIKIFSHRILFFIHLFAYVAVSLLIILIWAVLAPMIPTPPTPSPIPKGYFLPIFPIFGWGFAVGAHSLIYLMYNDKVKYLSELREQSVFKILFIFHAWFYGMINLFVLIIDLTTLPEILFFHWSLLGWGVAFAFHAFGFFTWDKALEAQKIKLREKHPDYSEERLKEFATSKLLGIEVLLMHITYFVVIAVITYSTQLWLTYSTLENILQVTVGWTLFLGLHILAYYLFNFNKKLSVVMKGLILHVIAYVGLIFIGLWEQFTDLTPFWWHIPVVLWLFFIGIHILVTLKWDSINTHALEKVKSRSREEREEYKYQRLTYWVLFWRFTFIAHIFAYILGLVLLIPYIDYIAALITVYLPIDLALTFSSLLSIIAFGWLIGLLVHGAMCIIATKQIKAFLMWTAILHSAAYIGGIPLLITINLITITILPTPTILWSAIALGGWAIGLGVHLLLAYLTRKK